VGDYTIAKVSWLTRRKGNESRREQILAHFEIVVRFLLSNQLTTHDLLSGGKKIDDEFFIRASDLTGEGIELMKQGYEKWISKIVDKGKNPSDVSILKDTLSKIRSSKTNRK
jgi:hypothetical protein